MHGDAVAIPLADDATLPGHHEGRRQAFGGLEGGVHRGRDLLLVELGGKRLVGQHIAHRPRCGRRVRQRAVDLYRREVDVLGVDRQRRASLVADHAGRPHDTIGERQVNHLVVPIDLAIDHVGALVVGTAEIADVFGDEIGVETGDEHSGTEDLGEAGGVVMQRISRRWNVLGVELELGRTRQHRFARRHFRTRRLLATGALAGEGEQRQQYTQSGHRDPRFRELRHG